MNMNMKYIIAIVLAASTNIALSFEPARYSAIGEVVKRGDIQKIKELINNGQASINDSIYANKQESLLIWALSRPSEWVNKELVKTLIELGININAQDQDGNTALHIAAYDEPEIVELLLDHGADPSIENAQHMTPYAIAVEQGNQKMKELLSQRKQQGFSKIKGDALTLHKQIFQ